jgi:ABC-type tungstate transport system substrate-binding protein
LVTAFLTFPSVIVGVLMFTMLSTYRFLHHDN